MTARPLGGFSIGGGRRLGGLVLLGAFVGVVVGLMSARVSPAMPIAVAFAAATVIVVARRPEVGALAVVCLTLVVPRELLFERGVSLGGGSLKVTDLLILLTLAAWIAHRALDRDARRLPSMAASLLVLGIVLCGVGALLTNADRGGSTQFALTDFRPFLSLLLVFPLVAFVSDQPSLRRSLGAVLLAAAAGGVWISFLFLRGEGAKASFSGGALRVTEVSFVAPMIATVWALVLLPHCRTIGQRTAVAFLAVASFSALFFTLQRAAWISLAVGGLVAAILMTPRRRARLLSSVVVILLCAGVAIVALNSVSSARVGNPLQSGLERLQSVGSYETDVSALHREAETREALRADPDTSAHRYWTGWSNHVLQPVLQSGDAEPRRAVHDHLFTQQLYVDGPQDRHPRPPAPCGDRWLRPGTRGTTRCARLVALRQGRGPWHCGVAHFYCSSVFHGPTPDE